MPSNHLVLCHLLLLLPLMFSSIRVFSNEPFLHIRWPKYWSFRFSVHTYEPPGVLSGKIGWGTLSLHSPPASLFSSVSQLCPTLCYPMDRSMPSFPVHHQFPELTQTNVHRVSDAIHPPHPLSSPSPPAFNLSQLQGLFQ